MWETQALGLTEATEAIDRAADGIDHPEVFWDSTGALMVGADIRRGFDQGGLPVKWVDITAKSRAQRRVNRASGPLIDSAALEDAAAADHPGVAGSLFGVRGDTLTEGTDLVQAAVMEYGWEDKNIAARPFEHISELDEIRLTQAMDDDWLHRLLAAM